VRQSLTFTCLPGYIGLPVGLPGKYASPFRRFFFFAIGPLVVIVAVATLLIGRAAAGA